MRLKTAATAAIIFVPAYTSLVLVALERPILWWIAVGPTVVAGLLAGLFDFLQTRPSTQKILDKVRKVKAMKFNPKNPKHTSKLLFFACAVGIIALLVAFVQVAWTGLPMFGDFVLPGNISVKYVETLPLIALLLLLLQRGMWWARAHGVNKYSVFDLLVTLAPWGIAALGIITIFFSNLLTVEWFGKAVFSEVSAKTTFWFCLVVLADLYLHFFKKQVQVAERQELPQQEPIMFPEVENLFASTGLDEVGPFPVLFKKRPDGMEANINDADILAFLLQHRRAAAA